MVEKQFQPFTIYHSPFTFFHAASSSISACGSMVRISKIEIMGRNLMNRNSRLKKSPIVPRYIDQSQNVGWYMPHDDGRKSLCRLVTTITNRSSHMPMLTTTAISQSRTVFLRKNLNQRSCGVTQF